MFRATLYPSSGADDLVVFLLACFHVLLGGLLWLMVSAVVYRCDLMCKLNNLHTCGCVGSQIRLAGCVFIWGPFGVRWMARSKSGFGLPGDCLQNCSYVVSRCWLWMSLRRVIRLSIVPYSCLLFSMCCAYADCGLLILMYLICSL